MAMALPVQDQDAGHSVWYDGFGFTFSEELGSSVNITDVIGDDPDVGPLAPSAPSTRFSLYGPARNPRAGGQRGTVELYRVDELSAYPAQTATLQALQALLADRPDLDPAADESPDSIPMLKDVGAAQAIRFLPTYVDADQLSGIVFVTAFTQDTFPFSDDSFTAIFQGISADGTTAITASIPLTIRVFPGEVSAAQIDRVFQEGGWERYLRQSLRRLRQAPEEAFAPSIGAIGAMVGSMTFTVGPEPTPSASPDAG
jgi:hypothetical protein